MVFRMLLPPKLKKERRHVPKDSPGSMNSGVAPRTQRDHQIQDRSARHPMMNDDGTLIPPRCFADPAAVAIPLQNRLTKATEIFLILPFERVTGCTQPMRKNLQIPATAMQRSLDIPFSLRSSCSIPIQGLAADAKFAGKIGLRFSSHDSPA